jgi:hypothetical protein
MDTRCPSVHWRGLRHSGVFDRPPAGRMGFEGVIGEQLEGGRPDQRVWIFPRRVSSRTPETFPTRVVSRGVDPTRCCRSSRVKQYFQQGRALRTETVLCNPGDCDLGRRVCTQNGKALRAVGESAHRGRWDAAAADAPPAPGVAWGRGPDRPLREDGLYAPGLRLGEQRVMAILAAW